MLRIDHLPGNKDAMSLATIAVTFFQEIAFIHQACRVVLERFAPIRSVDDFTGSSAGMEKLDSICMQLIAIGESLKKIDTMTNGT